MSFIAKLLFVLLFMTVFAMWATFPTFIAWMVGNASKDAWEVRGVFGDSFGVLNSLFTALAFCGVVVTLYLQSVQLKLLQSKEADVEEAQALQVRLMAMTAALNHYTAEGARMQVVGIKILEAIAKGTKSTEDTDSKNWKKSFDQNNRKRDAILGELEALMTPKV